MMRKYGFINRLKQFFCLSWFNTNIYHQEINEDIEFKEDSRLLGTCKCYILLDEGVCLSIENDFEGVVIGKGNNTLKLVKNFKGFIFCEKVILCEKSSIIGDIYTSIIVVSTNEVFLTGSATMFGKGKSFNDINLWDIKGLSIEAIKQKCDEKIKS